MNIFKWLKWSKKYKVQIHFKDSLDHWHYTPIWFNFIRYHNIYKRKAFSGDLDNFPDEMLAIYKECLAEHRGHINSFISDYIEFDSEEDRVEFLLRMSNCD